MKVLLVQPNNITYRGTLCPPLGLMHVGAVAREAGHEVRILDRNLDLWTLKKTLDFKPDVVGVTTFTGPMIRDALVVSKFVKENLGRDVPVVWGGVHPSLMPEQTLESPWVDYVVRGEELAFPPLLEAIQGRRPIESVKGIGYKRGGKIFLTEEQPLIENLDELPMLPWDLVNAKAYLDLETVMVTSRGCPFKCAFCYNIRFNKSRWRTFGIDRIIKEIQVAESLTSRRLIKFHDDNFAVNRQRMNAILDYLSPEYSINLEVRATSVDEELLSRLRKFRRAWVFVGVETGSERLLRHVSKHLRKEDIREAFRKMSREKNIFTVAAVIVGLPTETPEEFRETLDFLEELDPTWPSVQIFTPFPGSRFYEEWVEAGGDAPKSLMEWTRYAPDIGGTSLAGQKTLSYDPALLKRINLRTTARMVLNCLFKGDAAKIMRRFEDVSALKASMANAVEARWMGIRLSDEGL